MRHFTVQLSLAYVVVAAAFSSLAKPTAVVAFSTPPPTTCSPPLSLHRSMQCDGRFRYSCSQTTTTTSTSLGVATRRRNNVVDDVSSASDDPTTVSSLISSSSSSSSMPNNIDQIEAAKEAEAVVSVAEEADADVVYRNGLITVGFITLLFASNSPVIHGAYAGGEGTTPPPVLLLNAAVAVVAIVGAAVVGPLVDEVVPSPALLNNRQEERDDEASDGVDGGGALKALTALTNPSPTLLAGLELGLWKFLGTTANLYGLSLTSSDHGAFLIQLTTLLVPLTQGFMGVPIPARIWTAIGLALGGVAVFTQDAAGSAHASLQGDALCALAAVFYATYDLRLFKWGKLVPPLELITTKVATQSALSVGLLALLGWSETSTFLSTASPDDLRVACAVALWSGLAVNAVAPYLQVGGQQAVGPARAQILYASQPLWAALMGYVFLHETVGLEGLIGGALFLSAVMLAATADTPDPNCPTDICEV